MISTVVWGTGNVGRAAVRAVAAHPAPDLTAVPAADPAKVGRDAGELAGLDERLGVAATDDVGTVPAARPRAVVSAASGEVRPDAAPEDIARAVRSGAVVVTPSVYGLYDQRNAPPGIRAPLLDAVAAGGGPLFVSGVDPGWADDVLPLLISGIASRIDPIRCQEIFDYSTYDREDSVRHLVGMGQPMDHHPPMLLESVPTAVWGGQVRMMARALGAELDEVTETGERRPLPATVVTAAMGESRAGTQGAVREGARGARRSGSAGALGEGGAAV